MGPVDRASEVKLLLDTHIWLWSVESERRVSRRVARELERSTNELWVSPISIAEIGAQQRKGRIQIQGGLEDWVQRSVRTSELRWAAINEAVGFEYDRVSLSTADPADRWLVATARVYDLVLVTADEKILASNAVRTLPNE